MKNIYYLLKQLSNGEINTTRPMTDWSEKENITCPDEDYEYEAEIIKEQQEEDQNRKYYNTFNPIEKDSFHNKEDIVEEQEEKNMMVNENLSNNINLINYKYIQKVKEREGPLSKIINTLNLIKECINKVYAGNLKVRLFIDIYDYFESILEIINEKRNDDFYIIYKAKDTLKKIEEAIEQEQKLNKKGFDEFYDAIKDENWFDEEFDKIYEFVDCADVLIEEIFYIVSLLDNSSEYKIERKKSRYRKKGFKKKSSKYFKLLSEGHTFEDISKICGINIESVKKFFKRKLKEYKSSMNDDEIAINWTITKDQLNFFITFMLKKEGK